MLILSFDGYATTVGDACCDGIGGGGIKAILIQDTQGTTCGIWEELGENVVFMGVVLFGLMLVCIGLQGLPMWVLSICIIFSSSMTAFPLGLAQMRMSALKLPRRTMLAIVLYLHIIS